MFVIDKKSYKFIGERTLSTTPLFVRILWEVEVPRISCNNYNKNKGCIIS